MCRSNAASRTVPGESVAYTVRRGDTLYDIARRYGTTPEAIAAASGISVRKTLQIGERLQVVSGAPSAAPAHRMAEIGSVRVASAGSSSGGGGGSGGGTLVHTVRRGDTLWHLAQRYDTSVDELCAWNQISPRTVIRPGRQLTVGFK